MKILHVWLGKRKATKDARSTKDDHPYVEDPAHRGHCVQCGVLKTQHGNTTDEQFNKGTGPRDKAGLSVAEWNALSPEKRKELIAKHSKDSAVDLGGKGSQRMTGDPLNGNPAHDIPVERAAGKPQKQAVAIALSEQRRKGTGDAGANAPKWQPYSPDQPKLNGMHRELTGMGYKWQYSASTNNKGEIAHRYKANGAPGATLYERKNGTHVINRTTDEMVDLGTHDPVGADAGVNIAPAPKLVPTSKQKPASPALAKAGKDEATRDAILTAALDGAAFNAPISPIMRKAHQYRNATNVDLRYLTRDLDSSRPQLIYALLKKEFTKPTVDAWLLQYGTIDGNKK